MKLFGWVPSKLGGKAKKQISGSDHELDAKQGASKKEEWWMLSIGTLGNNININESEERPCRSKLTRCKKRYNVGQLQKELTKLLKPKLVKQEEEARAQKQSSFTPPLHQSRMDKLLRTIICNPQPNTTTVASSMKRYIEDDKHSDAQQQRPKASAGSKWVNTDTQYIVLEI